MISTFLQLLLLFSLQIEVIWIKGWITFIFNKLIQHQNSIKIKAKVLVQVLYLGLLCLVWTLHKRPVMMTHINNKVQIRGLILSLLAADLRTALVERSDFSSGTSSRSTKLIHGGVRYLQKAIMQLDYEQVPLPPLPLHPLRPRLSLLSVLIVFLSPW